MRVRSDVPLIPLATRMPKELHRRMKVHCLESETTIMAFTNTAIRERLERKGARRRGASSS